MSSYQRVVVVGNLGKDVELKEFDNGGAIAKFSVAASEKWDGGEHTEWFNCEDGSKAAHNHAKYLSKGSKVLVEGTLRTREHNGKYYTTLRAFRVVYLGSKSDGQSKPAPQQQAPASEPSLDDIDVPF